MSTFINDIKFAIRQLRKSPGFTAVVVLTLALGIGANTAIFSVVYAVLLKPLPYPEAHRLVRFQEEWTPEMSAIPISYPNFLDWREQQTVFEAMGVSNFGSYNLTGRGDPIRLQGARMSAAAFSALGVQAAVGRVYTESEDQVGAPGVVTLSHAFWRDRFGADEKIINQSIMLNGLPHEIVGVMPRGFAYPSRVDIWVPMETLRANASFMDRNVKLGTSGVARLKEGVTIEQANADLKAISARVATQYPDNKHISARVFSLRDSVIGGDRQGFWILLGAVTLLLIIACVNVANLLLARAARRQREFAIRSAIGASRGRILRQLLTESVLLSVVGGGVGVLLAFVSVDAVRTLGQSILPRVSEIGVDGTVLAFAGLVTLLTGILFGLTPARLATGPEIEGPLRDSTRGSTQCRSGIRQWLVSGQVALTLTLLVGAGLLLRTFHQLLIVDPGFQDQHLLSFEIDLPPTKYETEAQRIGFYQPLLERLRDVPGVRAAGIASQIPLQGKGWVTTFNIEGRPAPVDGVEPSVEVSLASPGYLEAMQIPLLRGRTFNERDDRRHLAGREIPPDESWGAGLKAMIIDETFARRHWPDDDPIGKRIELPWQDPPLVLTVVGVVGRVKLDQLTETGGVSQCYLPFLQAPQHGMTVVLKTTIPPQQMVAAAREAVHDIDATQPLYNIRTVSELRDLSISRQRLNLTLMMAFATVALTLAAVGLYGVLAFDVTQQRRELGIRMALGAQKSDMLWQVLRQGLRWVVIGCVIGLVAAMGLAHAMRAMLFRVGPMDPLTFAAVSLLLLGVAALASWIPARRAMHADPAEALRNE